MGRKNFRGTTHLPQDKSNSVITFPPEALNALNVRFPFEATYSFAVSEMNPFTPKTPVGNSSIRSEPGRAFSRRLFFSDGNQISTVHHLSLYFLLFEYIIDFIRKSQVSVSFCVVPVCFSPFLSSRLPMLLTSTLFTGLKYRLRYAPIMKIYIQKYIQNRTMMMIDILP